MGHTSTRAAGRRRDHTWRRIPMGCAVLHRPLAPDHSSCIQSLRVMNDAFLFRGVSRIGGDPSYVEVLL